MKLETLTDWTATETIQRAARSQPVMIVDTQAVCRNFGRLAGLAGGECAAVVKGDAYGHGMRDCSAALHAAGANLFFVARFDDAVVLRQTLGSGPRIAVLDGIGAAFLPDAAALSIMPVVNSLEQLAALADFARRDLTKAAAFVHIDTAMNRLGIAHDDTQRAAELMSALEVAAYMTHFASADDMNLELCRKQVWRLKAAVMPLPPAPLSIANSSAVFLGQEFHGDIIRPGKSTFGINPLPEDENPMEAPATVFAPIVQLRDVAKGEAIGYSETWRAPSARRVAILAIGYANGYLRSNSNRGCVAFQGRLAPVLGRVSMDLTAVDVTGLPDAWIHEGSLAEITGPTISYRHLAANAGTNEHEAIIDLGRGCRRYYSAAPEMGGLAK